MLIARYLLTGTGSRNLLIHNAVWKRLVHNGEVRVRFAPSPTGELHLGGLRTALYNYLFARHHKGKFILRIEDTDQTRLVPGAAERLMEDLHWAGIEIDEGPGYGGKYGPYIQSQRAELYEVAVQQLIDNGSAYRCFCTERRLDLLRKDALRLRQVPRYDNKCRALNAEQLEDLLQKGTPHCVRFKLSEDEPILQDLIYGRVEHNVSETEGDPVIMKSCGLPTYHLANVVDDHLMNITHVLRGVEWQISTPKHLLMYRAFGWKPPLYGHLPLLVNADGTKLSKRQGDIGIKQFREKGYFPAALLNYVVSAGGGFPHESATKPRIYALPELAENFQLERVNAHASRLNPALLQNFNRLELMRRLSVPELQAELVEQVQILVAAAFGKVSQNLDLEASHILHILQWAAKRLNFLTELTAEQLSFLWIKPAPQQQTQQTLTEQQVEKLLRALRNEELEFSKEGINKALKSFAAEQDLKLAEFMKVLRLSLSGLQQGPGVAEMMHILGRQTVLQRLESALLQSHKINLKNVEKLTN